MVSVAGVKEYIPLLSTIFISAEFVDVDGEVAGVDSEVVTVVGTVFGAAGVAGLAGALAAPPQAASIRTTIVASKEINQADCRRCKF